MAQIYYNFLIFKGSVADLGPKVASPLSVRSSRSTFGFLNIWCTWIYCVPVNNCIFTFFVDDKIRFLLEIYNHAFVPLLLVVPYQQGQILMAIITNFKVKLIYLYNWVDGVSYCLIEMYHCIINNLRHYMCR